MKKNRVVPAREATELFRGLGQDFALIHNPSFVHPEYEVVPLARKISHPKDGIIAVVMDMDGTTTTTEELCIHSLEFMVRAISGRPTKSEWAGLDHKRDYPHIIGNSTTRHVEFLINRYADAIKPDEMRQSYLHAALWTVILADDQDRVAQVRQNLFHLGCGEMLRDRQLEELIRQQRFPPDEAPALVNEFLLRYGGAFRADSPGDMVRAAIDIYYQRYHEILEMIKRGEGEQLSRDLLGAPHKHLIEPMPGIGISLALLKGWLGEEAGGLHASLLGEMKRKSAATPVVDLGGPERLQRLGMYCERHPLRIAVVTSSISYEANIVMSEVFRVLKEQVMSWDISTKRKEMIYDKFSSYQNVYDGFVTASDSNEIRLKPHRDLYSIALHQLGIPKRNFHRVAGFEDSESGTIAIRAAGIGLCIAVPFAKTSGHDFDAASHVLPGGLPEAVLAHNLFMNIRR